VAVAVWQWQGVAGERMEGIVLYCIIRELCVFVAVAVAGWQ
jgi:hypothetical protein